MSKGQRIRVLCVDDHPIVLSVRFDVWCSDPLTIFAVPQHVLSPGIKVHQQLQIPGFFCSPTAVRILTGPLLKQMVLDSVTSPNTRWSYQDAGRNVCFFCRPAVDPCIAIASMDELAPSTVNVKLSASPKTGR